jgi:peroxiredoxin
MTICYGATAMNVPFFQQKYFIPALLHQSYFTGVITTDLFHQSYFNRGIKDMTETDTLAAQMQQLLENFISGLPQETQQTVGGAFEKLLSSDVGDQAPGQGDKVPDFELPSARGESVRLSELLQQGPVVLSFYRGGWCPFCNLEFKALSDIQPEISAMGATLVGVSPETPDNALTTAEKYGLPFEVLSDAGNRVADAYGLVMTLYEELRPLYKEWGIDVPAANGDDSYQLPIPATYIIGQDGTVHAAYVNKNYTQRMEPADILQALKSL